jgi:hypothetical protein
MKDLVSCPLHAHTQFSVVVNLYCWQQNYHELSKERKCCSGLTNIPRAGEYLYMIIANIMEMSREIVLSAHQETSNSSYEFGCVSSFTPWYWLSLLHCPRDFKINDSNEKKGLGLVPSAFFARSSCFTIHFLLQTSIDHDGIIQDECHFAKTSQVAMCSITNPKFALQA